MSLSLSLSLSNFWIQDFECDNSLYQHLKVKREGEREKDRPFVSHGWSSLSFFLSLFVTLILDEGDFCGWPVASHRCVFDLANLSLDELVSSFSLSACFSLVVFFLFQSLSIFMPHVFHFFEDRKTAAVSDVISKQTTTTTIKTGTLMTFRRKRK